jgi:hypothetical protein
VAPVTHQPAPGDTQGNVSRQLAGAVVLGGGAAPAPPLLTGSRVPLRFFNSSGLVKRAVPRPSGPGPEGLAGMAELGPLLPGGGAPGGTKPLLLHAPFLVFKKTAARLDGKETAAPWPSSNFMPQGGGQAVARSYFETPALVYSDPTRQALRKR